MAALVKPTKSHDIVAWLEQNCIIPASRSRARWRIWKRGYISTVRPAVNNKSSRPKWSFFGNALQTRGIKTSALFFSVEEKQFKNETLRKQRHYDNHSEFSSNTNPKWQVIATLSNTSGVTCKDVFGGKFSEWKRRFQILPPCFRRDLILM